MSVKFLHHRVGLALSTSILALSIASAHAADQQIETVVVTAQKKKESIEKVPVSVKAITGDELNEINADSAEDYLRMVPSVSMTSLSRGGNQIQIRGLGSDVANVGTITIYNDGVVAPSQNQAAGAYSAEDPALYDIDRVEVLRGPQGTLYGEGSLGGVINIISKRPDLENFDASASMSWFNRAHGTSDNEDLAGMVNVPLDTGKLALRVVAYDDMHDGWINQVDIGPYLYDNAVCGYPCLGTSAPIVKKDVNTEHVYGGRAMLTYKPNNDFDATLIFKSEVQDLGGTPVSSPLLTEGINAFAGTNYNPYYTQVNLFDQSGTSQTDQLILEMNADLGIGKLTSVSGWGSDDGSSESMYNLGGTGLSGDKVSRTAHAWNEELRLASDPDQPLSWIVGGYYRHNDYDLALGLSAPGFVTSPFSTDSESETAVFGQAYWKFLPLWTATVGLRYAYQTSSVTQNGPFLSTKGQFHSLVPKFSVDYQPDGDSLYYATVSEGFRAGGANVDVSLGTDPSFVGPFRPDTDWNYELGAKKTFWDDMLTVNAAVFYIAWDDVQIDHSIISVISPPTGFITINGKNAHSTGVEADVYFNPAPDWTITAGGDILNAQYDNGAITGVAGTVPLKGQIPASTPKYTANLSVERRFAIADDMGGYIRADYSLRGSSYGDVPNTDPGPGNTLATGQSQIVNLRAGIQKDFWEFQVFSNNLFDTHASGYTFEEPASFVDEVAVLPPRTIGINLKLHY